MPLSFSLPGWQWSPLDRPSFAEIHQAFETMFHDSSISEGNMTCIFVQLTEAGPHLVLQNNQVLLSHVMSQ